MPSRLRMQVRQPCHEPLLRERVMQPMSVGLRPVAAAAMLAGLWSITAHANEPVMPSTTVLEAADALNPAQTPYVTETVTKEDIERKQIIDIRDAVRNMVNVEVPRTARRGTGIGGAAGRDGNTGFEIRGLGGNRVLTLVDGIPQPEADSFQNSHSFGRDYVDPLTLSAIEVHKGGLGAELPGGAMGAAVNMRTLSPSDLLGLDTTLAGRAMLGWRSDNSGWSAGAAMAGKPSEQLQWLFAIHGERSDATETMGKVGGTGLQRTQANPEDNRRSSWLGKLVFRPHADQTHVLTAEQRHQDTAVENLHDFDNGTTRRHTEDMGSTRSRLSLQSDWRVDSPAADRLLSYVAWQDSSSAQDLVLDTTTANGLRLRDHRYDERQVQLGLTARKQIGNHSLSYGFDMSRMDSQTQSLSTDRGVTTSVPKGPDSRTDRWGMFVQDVMHFGDWTVQPGLRYASVRIKPDASSIDTSASGFDVVSKRFSAWLPQLGAQWQINPGLQTFANYHRGFRAPTSSELNNYFGNITPYYGYFILPNPDLKAETSNNLELGLRDAVGSTQWEAVLFYGRYRNFIEVGQPAGVRPGRPAVSLMQSRNQAKTTIKGFELKGRTELGQSWGGTWVAQAGYGYTKGKGEDGQGLNEISPQKLRLALGQKAARWNWELAATHSAAKKASDLAADTTSQFLSPSHTVLDLTGQFSVTKGVRVNVGLFNLTDKKYWNWGDVRNVSLPTEAAAIDAYSQSGRSVRVSVVADF